jgi:hypothetical protein
MLICFGSSSSWPLPKDWAEVELAAYLTDTHAHKVLLKSKIVVTIF